MAIHPDKTAYRAVDACGGTYTPEQYASGFAEGHAAALDAALEAVKKPDELSAELLGCLVEMKELFRFALLCTTPDIARDGMEFIRKADAVVAKASAQ